MTDEQIQNHVRCLIADLKAVTGIDTCQIIMTRTENDQTDVIPVGFGNIYAREGAVRSWLEGQGIAGCELINEDEVEA